VQPFVTLTGIVAPLEALNVDTDQIIPKQFLKRIGRTGFDDALFFDWRFNADGSLNPEFEMNAPRYKGAGILLAKDNFGCGSSREHAPWALLDYGIRCVLAPSFADIFYNNCFNNGMLPIRVSEATIEQLFNEVRAKVGYQLAIDLPNNQIVKPDGSAIRFELDPFKKECLLNGWDTIGLTLRNEDRITAFEKAHATA
jgi:3-isopropylmalate/(R)-2-methylmalate dehydratase small subunit